ncbi:MAG: hypothetical protein VB078_04310 [Clostridiaceae bacterium]|nr:hypothetical protein [Clostridiaceae bacterium]
MRSSNLMMAIVAGAAIGAVAGIAANEMGMVNGRQLKSQAKKAVRAMEQMTDKLS